MQTTTPLAAVPASVAFESPYQTPKAPTEFPKQIVQIGRVHCAVGYAMSNSIAVEVDGGYVVIDTLPSLRAAEEVKAEFDARIRGQVQAIIYTHSHVDHIHGTSIFHRPGVPIWAHHLFEQELSQKNRTAKATYLRCAKQFGYFLDPEVVETGGIGPPLTFDDGALPPLKFPTHIVRDKVEVGIGGVRFEMHVAPGETHDHLFIWLPQERILIAGDNIYRSFPNLYAIRGVPARPVLGWIQSLDAMRYLDPAPEHLIMGHTEPVSGAETIQQLLTDYRDAIAFVHDSVLRLLDEGKTPDEMVEQIQLPAHLREHEFLQEHYGSVAWSVRAIYDGYMGWFEGDASRLEPLSAKQLSERLLPQLGGRQRILHMIDDALHTGDVKWAVWLCDQLLAGDFQSKLVRRKKANALEQLAATATNPLMRNWYLTEARMLTAELHPPQMPKVNARTLEDYPVESMIRLLPQRLRPGKAAKMVMTVGFEFTDSGREFTFFIRRGVGEVVPFKAQSPDLLIRTTEDDFKRAMVVREIKPRSLEFWRKVHFDVPGQAWLAPLKKLWRLKRFASCLLRP